MMPITERIAPPTPEDVRAARQAAGLTQTQAAQLISTAQRFAYRSWQSYEVAQGQPGARVIPLASWELFLLLTQQHPLYRLTPKHAVL